LTASGLAVTVKDREPVAMTNAGERRGGGTLEDAQAPELERRNGDQHTSTVAAPASIRPGPETLRWSR
jgi:hypothetical protein